MATEPVLNPDEHGPAAAPVRSMTGYGAAERLDADWRVRVEVRSVNHRHLSLKIVVPSRLAALEPEVEALVRHRLQRGSVQVALSCTPVHDALPARLATEVARAWRTELRALANDLGLDDRPTLADILGLPGVVVVGGGEPGAEAIRVLAATAVEMALDDLLRSREREGGTLVSEVVAQLDRAVEAVRAIDARWPAVVAEYRQRLKQRLNDYLAERGVTFLDTDLWREVAVFGERCDVAEETARLLVHLAETRRLLAQGGSVGRQLEFMAQELMREANTVGSKASDADLPLLVVTIKTAIDRIREQVQNLE
jgi:uncharacterized protein (TIGR00255 family)